MEANQLQRVLIVEDDLALKPFWDVVLKRCFTSWKADWAVSGEQAQKLINKAQEAAAPYSLIISDIFLAGSLTGLDLIRSSNHATKFLLVSVADGKRVENAVLDVPTTRAVLTKPLNVPRCERAITELIYERVG